MQNEEQNYVYMVFSESNCQFESYHKFWVFKEFKEAFIKYYYLRDEISINYNVSINDNYINTEEKDGENLTFEGYFEGRRIENHQKVMLKKIELN